MEDKIVTHHLYQSLFPSLSLSVSVEYEQLLVDFLDHLYDSFDAHHVVVDFAYANDALSPFAKMLTKRGKDDYHFGYNPFLTRYHRCEDLLQSALLHQSTWEKVSS